MGTHLVFGVTGLPCSGKSHAASRLAEALSARLIKADELGHAVLHRPEVAAALRERFGSEAIVPGDPPETRRRIARVVFGDPAELAWLEGLTHPLIGAEAGRIISGLRNGRAAVVEAALLFAAGMENLCDLVFLIEADVRIRRERAARRGWDAAELERREQRIRPLFEAAALETAKDRLVRVRNDADDGAMEKALAEAVDNFKTGFRPRGTPRESGS